MEAIKKSPNVGFDVIYADGTRHHVAEGVLFEVKDEKLVFHNGTDRPEVMLAVSEGAAEVVGNMNLPDGILIEHLAAICKNLTEGGHDNGV